MRSTIQSNKALYRDLAMESRAVMACGTEWASGLGKEALAWHHPKEVNTQGQLRWWL